jgi:hypothetical protein
VAFGAAAFAVWWLFIALLVHDPLGFLHGSPSWGHSSGLVQILDLVRHRDPRAERVAGVLGLACEARRGPSIEIGQPRPVI